MIKNLFLLFIAVLLCAAAAPAQRKGDIRSLDFRNLTYQSSVCAEDFGIPADVKLKNGKFRDNTLYYQLASDRIVYGDLWGDKTEAAVVQIVCGDTVGNFSDAEILVFTLEKGQPKLFARIDNKRIETDYKRFFKNGFIVKVKPGVRIAGRSLFVEAYTDGSNASPKNIATFNYRMLAGRLAIAGQPKRRPA